MSIESRVAVMDQYSVDAADTSGAGVQSALAHAVVQSEGATGVVAIAAGRHQRGSAIATVALEEAAVTGLLVLRAGSASSALSKALQTQLTLSLPERLQSSETSTCCIRWMSPDEWLLSCPLEDCFAIEKALRSSVVGDDAQNPKGHIAIVNVSGGYSVLKLMGTDASNVLKKSMAYDIDPVNFPVGKVVNTTLAKTQVTLRALPDTSYELVIRRSFADYVWLWLQRAGMEYGLGAVSQGGR